MKPSTENKRNFCIIYLARHGETEWNVRRIIQGHLDSKLTEKGEEQARELARVLRDIRFDHIFSSDLLRAKRSAEIISIEHNLAVKTSKALRERKFGRFEGKSVDTYRDDLKGKIERLERLTDEERVGYRVAEDTETDEGIIVRFITFLREIAVAYAGETILIVSHVGLIKAFLVHTGFASYSDLPTRAVSNTAYVKFLSDGVEFFIKETVGIKNHAQSDQEN